MTNRAARCRLCDGREQRKRETGAPLAEGILSSDEFTRLLLSAGAPSALADAIVKAREVGNVGPLLRFVLLRSLWREVVDEAHEGVMPGWVGRWLELEESGFPFIDSSALRRLRDSGADLDDVTDVVRSAQVALIYNVACMLDDGAQTVKDLLGDAAPDATWQLVTGTDPSAIVAGLHDSVEELDPTGRFGEPRSIEERRLWSMSPAARGQLVAALSEGRMAQAALLWRKEIGEDHALCVASVQRLADIHRRRGARSS